MAITLKAARVNADLTQAQLADMLGLSRQTIMDYENGAREVPTVYLIAFCHVTGFGVDDISLPSGTTKSSQGDD